MSIFDELKTSLEEAVEIHSGRKAASRITRYEVADVRAIREQLNITQCEMAKALGTSVDTIKAGSPNVATQPGWRRRYLM